MEFDSGSQKMKCPFCDTEVSIEEFEQEQKKNPEETRWEAGNGTVCDIGWLLNYL